MSVRIVDVCEVTKPISSPIRNAYIDFTKMTTSLVAVVTDAKRDSKRVVGYGFNSNGRYGQGGLIRERFAPRLIEADPKNKEAYYSLGVIAWAKWYPALMTSRAALPIRARPAANIGLAHSAPPDGLTSTSPLSPRARRSRIS